MNNQKEINNGLDIDWYATTYRKVFFDFHSHSAAVGLARKFDAEKWAKSLLKIHAQAVSVFAKCGFGWSYYQKGKIRYIHPQLPTGLDMLEEQIQALHKCGIRTIGYYHTFKSQPIARDHPEWVERDITEKPRDDMICMLGPLLEEWMLPHVEEIVTNYDVDAMFFDGTRAIGVCYCQYCKEKFFSETGLDLPGDNKDGNWARYVAWKLEVFKQIRQKICNAIHKHRPEMPISFNWCYTLEQPESVPDDVGSLVLDIRPDDQVFNGSYQARHWGLLERPFDIMNTAFLRWWGDWGCKPAIALQQEVSTIIANGGLTWIGYQMSHEFDIEPAVMNELGRTLSFVKEREHLLKDAKPVPYIAVLTGTDSYFAQDEVSFDVAQVALRGIHKILLESGFHYHFVHEAVLRERLNEFKAIILPDQRRLSPELVDDLNVFVKNGGVVIATYLTGTLDGDYRNTGKFCLEDLFGVRLEKEYEQSHAYIETIHAMLKKDTLDMPHLCEGRFAFVKPIKNDVEVMARLLKIYLRQDGECLLSPFSPAGDYSGYPAITLRRVGKGTVIYIAGQIFKAYQKNNQWNIKKIVASLLKMTIKEKIIQIDSPVWLEVVLMSREKQIIVHLINHHGDRPVDKNYVCTEQIPIVKDVHIKIACSKPRNVILEPGKITNKWKYKDGVLEVHIAEVHMHTAVVVEC